MSLKLEIETWVQALSCYDKQDYENALAVFSNIAETSKIFFNCGVIYATIGEHAQAVQCYQKAVELDKFFAIAYFQEGVSNFLLGDFEEALANFNDTLLYLRGNMLIDYEQLGLKFRLFSCEVLFNRGLCYIYICQTKLGMQDLQFAAQEKVTQDHRVIDDAIQNNPERYTVFSIPVGVLYRPNEAKVKNLQQKNYLGKSRLVSATEGLSRKPSIIDKPKSISHAASNIIQRNLHLHSRQNSEPPINRNLLPPTPPPDSEKATISSTSSRNSSINGNGNASGFGIGIGRIAPLRTRRPPRLDLNRLGARFGRRPSHDEGKPAPAQAPAREKPRIGTTRTASETRGPQEASSKQKQSHTRGFSHDTGKQQLLNQEKESTQSQWRLPNYPGLASPPDDNDGIDTKPNRPGTKQGHRNEPTTTEGKPYYIDEEAGEGNDDYDSGPCDEILIGNGNGNGSDTGSFEIMSPKTAAPEPAPVANPNPNITHKNNPQQLPPTQKAQAPPTPEIHKFRIKAHTLEDTRYIMLLSPNITFDVFEDKIRSKFGFRQSRLRITMRDDGDVITMGDQEDLELLMASARDAARREGGDMGKMEIWVEERG